MIPASVSRNCTNSLIEHSISILSPRPMSKKGKARYIQLTIRIIAAKLFSSAGTGYQYVLRRRRNAEKFMLRKYDPIGNLFLNQVNAHVLFTENKPS